jgi:hypothetical protein
MAKRSTNFTGKKPIKGRHVLSLMEWVGMTEEEIMAALSRPAPTGAAIPDWRPYDPVEPLSDTDMEDVIQAAARLADKPTRPLPTDASAGDESEV